MLAALLVVSLSLASFLETVHGHGKFRPNPVRVSCSRSGRFENPHKDHALMNHVVATHKVMCRLDCTQACLEDDRCASFNYQYSTSDATHLCELNDLANISSRRDYVARPGFQYYHPLIRESGIGLACSSDPCQNGGTCVESCGNPDHFSCECRQDYTGEFCHIHSRVKNCVDLRSLGADSGVYNVDPDGQGLITVYCDQTTDGGGWTVFQRRISPFSTNFNRYWEAYRVGFGDLNAEFWLGNDNIHRITADGVTMRVDLRASGGQVGYAKYENFVVEAASNKYRWSMNSYSGNIGNAIYGSGHAPHNTRGMKFSTPDQDNDQCPCHCSSSSGSWKNWCGHVDFNSAARPSWNFWRYKSTVIFSEVKVRP